MRVIEDNHNSLRDTCIYCKSVLKIHVDDIRGGDIGAYFYTCCVCERVNKLHSCSLPTHIMAKL